MRDGESNFPNSITLHLAARSFAFGNCEGRVNAATEKRCELRASHVREINRAITPRSDDVCVGVRVCELLARNARETRASHEVSRVNSTFRRAGEIVSERGAASFITSSS